MTGHLEIDDLEGLAREGWRLGQTLCVDCGRYHQLRGVIRAAKVVNGPDTDQEMLASMVAETVRDGARILIAGAGDPGQLQMIAALATARPLRVDIVDRCPAPLALIDALTPLAGITVTTRLTDLTSFEAHEPYDLILSHSMLPFLAPADRSRVLGRFHASLSPTGRLLLVVPVAPAQTELQRRVYDEAWAAKVREKIAMTPAIARIIGDELEAVLADYGPLRSARNGAFTDEVEVSALLRACGFDIVRQVSGGNSVVANTLGHAKRKLGFLAVPADRR